MNLCTNYVGWIQIYSGKLVFVVEMYYDKDNIKGQING